jgi:hypothetical protein
MIKMSERVRRRVFFVCVSINKSGELVTQVVPANSPSEASQLYAEKHSHIPKRIMGPFYKKRSQILETTRVLNLTNETKKAHYNDWLVNAFILKEPIDQAFLVFIKRLDDKKIPMPKGTITVPLSELRFI